MFHGVIFVLLLRKVANQRVTVRNPRVIIGFTSPLFTDMLRIPNRFYRFLYASSKLTLTSRYAFFFILLKKCSVNKNSNFIKTGIKPLVSFKYTLPFKLY